MAAIVLRTAMVYIFLVAAMRIMGKRQLGELQVSELVTTLLLSELAALPIYDQNVPIVFSAAPVLLLLSFEIISSFVTSRNPKIKKIVEGTPSVLICRGVINQAELRRIRISLDELIGEVRLQSIPDISEIEYAILEQNGRLSIIQKAAAKPATVGDLSLKTDEKGLSHPIIIEGKLNKSALSDMGANQKWLDGRLKAHKTKMDDVYLFSVDDAKNENIVLIDKGAGK